MRKAKSVRVKELLTIGLEIAEGQPFRTITRGQIARKAGIADSVVSYHFGTMSDFYTGLLDYAIEVQHNPVILQAISSGLQVPAESVQRALLSLGQAPSAQ